MRNLPLRTPHLLLCLLETHSHFSSSCFEHVDPRYLPELRGKLRQFVIEQAERDTSRTFMETDVNDILEVKKAGEIAKTKGAEFIDERFLLQAVLLGGGATVADIRNRLGDEKFENLLHVIETAPKHQLDQTPW